MRASFGEAGKQRRGGSNIGSRVIGEDGLPVRTSSIVTNRTSFMQIGTADGGRSPSISPANGPRKSFMQSGPDEVSVGHGKGRPSRQSFAVQAQGGDHTTTAAPTHNDSESPGSFLVESSAYHESRVRRGTTQGAQATRRSFAATATATATAVIAEGVDSDAGAAVPVKGRGVRASFSNAGAVAVASANEFSTVPVARERTTRQSFATKSEASDGRYRGATVRSSFAANAMETSSRVGVEHPKKSRHDTSRNGDIDPDFQAAITEARIKVGI